MEPAARRERITELVLLYRVIRAEWIYPALYEGLTIHSAHKDLQMMRDDGLLLPFEDADGRVYYAPTEKLAALNGMHRSYGRSGGEVSRAQRVGLAAYCMRYSLPHYPASDFAHAYPKLAAAGGEHGNYFVDVHDDQIDIGMIEVDCNTKGDVRRIVRKCVQHFRVRARNAAWKQLIDNGMFHVVIVAPSEGKKRVLEQKLGSNKKLLGPVYVEVVEELQPFLLQQDWRPSWQGRTSRSSSKDRPRSATGTRASGGDERSSGDSSSSS